MSDHDQDARAADARRTILIVDDDPLYLRMVARYLRHPGDHILTANSSTEALAVAAAHAGRIDLLLTDVILPGLDGGRLAERLRETHPDLRALFMSGYSSEILGRIGVVDGADRFAQKPFTQAFLRAWVDQTLGDARP